MKTLKKVSSIVLALCLCFSLTAAAFAAGSETTGSITITDSQTDTGAVKGSTYNIYRIFELTYASDEQGNDTQTAYTYKVAENWQGVITSGFTFEIDGMSYTPFTIDADGYLDQSSAVFNYNDTQMAALAKALLSSAGSITATATNTATDDTITFSELPLGWYLVDSSLGTLCMLTNTTPNATIEEKNSVPTIDGKYVEVLNVDENYREADDADANDTLQYEIILKDVANGESVCLHDHMDAELQLHYTKGNADITLYKYSSGDYDTITTGYTITAPGTEEHTGEDGSTYKCAFEIQFEDAFLATLDETDEIIIIYKVDIDAANDTFDNDIEDWVNEAHLTYGTSMLSGPVVRTDTYSYGIEVYKYTETDIATDELHEAEMVYLEPGEYYVLCTAPYIDWLSYETDVSSADDASNLFIMSSKANSNSSKSRATPIEIESAGYYFIHFDVDENEEDGMLSLRSPWFIIKSEDAPSTLGDYTAETIPYDLINMETTYYTIINGYAVEVESTDGTGGTVESALAGAEFILKYVDAEDVTHYATLEYENAQGFYLLTGWTEDEADATRMKTPADGMILIEGLSHNETYYLEEVAAPDGFNLLAGDIEVEIILGGTKEEPIYSRFTVQYTYNGQTGNGIIEVLNSQGKELPDTGGTGTAIFYMIGGVLIIGAAAVLVTRRRLTREN